MLTYKLKKQLALWGGCRSNNKQKRLSEFFEILVYRYENSDQGFKGGPDDHCSTPNCAANGKLKE